MDVSMLVSSGLGLVFGHNLTTATAAGAAAARAGPGAGRFLASRILSVHLANDQLTGSDDGREWLIAQT